MLKNISTLSAMHKESTVANGGIFCMSLWL